MAISGSEAMKTRDGIGGLAIAGILAVGVMGASAANAVPDQPGAWEKCAGIVKAGMNDCGALDGKHACAGQATEDGSANEWVYLPKGTCTKITAGKVVGEKPAKS
jgi:uncharacterized membrane protein